MRARLSGLLDLEYYQLSATAARSDPGRRTRFVRPAPEPFSRRADSGRTFTFSPRRGVDTGFDPTDLGAQWRADEYALRVTPWSDGRFTLQVGKFATVIGGWVERHLSWENPFVNAPLPYETATLVSDLELPLTSQSFRAVPGFR